MVINNTFNNISVNIVLSVLLVKETGHLLSRLKVVPYTSGKILSARLIFLFF
jgi:hypothetical protein